MKLKYFLRGLGAGIIFGALIMLIAYMSSGAYKISDDEIIERAQSLGMVMDDKSVISSKDENASKNDAEPVSDLSDKSTTASTEEVPQITTEASTEESTEVSTEETTENILTTENKAVVVRPGMSSYEVAVILEDAGIISDANDFDAYLNSNGYSTKIEVGEFYCNEDMDYEELAKILTTPIE